MTLVLTESVITTFVLVLTRVSGLMLALPPLGAEVAPLRVRIAVALALAALLTPVAPLAPGDIEIVAAVPLELLAGAGMGLAVRLALAAVELAGEVVGMQAGFGFSRAVDPLQHESSGLVSRVLTLVGGLLLFATGAHLAIFEALGRSLTTLPPGAWGWRRGAAEILLDRAGLIFAEGLRIALPLVLLVFATQLSFGFMTRVAPQLNLWGLGFLVTIGVGVGALWTFAPHLVREMVLLVERSLLTVSSLGGI